MRSFDEEAELIKEQTRRWATNGPCPMGMEIGGATGPKRDGGIGGHVHKITDVGLLRS